MEAGGKGLAELEEKEGISFQAWARNLYIFPNSTEVTSSEHRAGWALGESICWMVRILL